MPSIKDGLKISSFKGFEFLVTSVTTEGGQKIAVHDFVNTSNRAVEDLGALPETFKVNAIITGDNYFQRVQTFKQTLSEGGRGDYVHYTQGTFPVKVDTFTVIETQKDLGAAEFNITFLRVQGEIQPNAVSINPSGISKKVEDAKTSSKENIQNNFVVPSFTGNLADSQTQVEEIGDSFTNASEKFFQATTGISEFRRQVTSYKTDALILIAAPEELASSTIDLFDSFGDLFDIPETHFSALQRLFDFGNNDIKSKNNTVGLIQRENNRDILRVTIQSVALMESYREVSLIDFVTVDNIDVAENILDTQYVAVKDQDGLDGDTQAKVTDLRVATRKFLTQQRINASRVIELNLPVKPSAVQSYTIYGNVDNADSLIELNDERNTQFIGGRNTKVITV